MRPRTDRRRGPRGVQPVQRVQCEIVGDPTTFLLREVGFGGFSMEGPNGLPTGSTHTIRFRFEDGDDAVVTAEARHTTPVRRAETDPLTFITGFAFANLDNLEGARTVNAIIDRVLSALTIEISD